MARGKTERQLMHIKSLGIMKPDVSPRSPSTKDRHLQALRERNLTDITCLTEHERHSLPTPRPLLCAHLLACAAPEQGTFQTRMQTSMRARAAIHRGHISPGVVGQTRRARATGRLPGRVSDRLESRQPAEDACSSSYTPRRRRIDLNRPRRPIVVAPAAEGGVSR